MSNTIRFEVIVDGKGIPKGIKQADDLNKSYKNLKRSADDATHSMDELHYKQNSGIAGNASAGRSFSKLAQTIGHGPNSLVGAYATLAANAMAVAAAFTALRNANQVELLMKGLEAQGARTGKTLSTVANSVKEITNGALSSADAMQAVALTSAAGFAAKDVEALTEVAKNASIALGRNLPDSMDRITKGVTKLEPELLDELGLVTKLTEATNAYALAHNKSALSLTAFEKRMAFSEAIKKEGAAKFGGIADETGVNSLDQLAASFANLTQQMFNWVNSLTIVSTAINVLTNSSEALLGTLLLFGNTMKTALLGFIYKFAEATAVSAQKSKDAADKELDKANAAKVAAKSQISLTRSMIATGSGVDSLSKGYQQYTQVLKKGTASTEDFNNAQKALDRSIRSYKGQITRFGPEGKNPDKEKLAIAQAKKEALDKEVLAITRLKTAEQDYARESIKLDKAKLDALTADTKATAQVAASNATALAGNLKFKEAFGQLKEASNGYKESLIMVAARAKGLTDVTQITQSTFSKAEKASFKLQSGLYNVALGARMAGSALLGMVPVIGTIMVLWGMLSVAYNTFIKTDAEKEKEKAYKALGEVLDSNAAKIKELARLETASISIGEKVASTWILKSNAVNELTTAYFEAMQEIDKVDKNREFFGGWSNGALKAIGAIKALVPGTALAFEAFNATSTETIARMHLVEQTGVEASSKLIDAFGKFAGVFKNGLFSGIGNLFTGGTSFSEETAVSIKALSDMDKIIPGTEKRFLELYKATDTETEALDKLRQVLGETGHELRNVATDLEELKVALKESDQAYQNLVRSKAPTTSFDQIVEKMELTNNAIARTILDMRELEKSGKATKDQVGALLTLIGSSNRHVLDINTQQALIKVDELTTKIQNVTNDRDAEKQKKSPNQQRILDFEAELKNYETSRSKILQAHEKSIRNSLTVYSDQVRQSQLQELSLDSQLRLQQAILAKMQKRAAVTAESLKQEIAQENAIIKLNAKKLELSMQVLKYEQEYLENQKKALERERKNIANTIDPVEQARLIALEARKTELSWARTYGFMNNMPVDPIANSMERASVEKEIAKIAESRESDTNRRAEELDLQIKSIGNQVVVNAARLNALSDEQKAILMGITSEKEASLLGDQLTIKNNTENLNILSAIKSAQEQRAILETQISDKVLGRSNALRDELVDIRRQFSERRLQSVIETANSVALLKNKKELAILDKKTADAQEYERQIQSTLKLFEVNQDLEYSKLHQSILEKLIVDTTKEGIEMQQKALEVIQQQISLQETLLDQRAELRKSDATIIAKKYGIDVDENLARRLELKQAKESYSLAVQNFELKVEGIKLEYALLEAQRVNTILQWKLSRDSAALTLKVMGKQSAETDLMLAQMDTAINNISQRSYSSLQDMAIAVAKGELDIKRKKVEELSAELEPKAPGILNEIYGAFANIEQLRKARRADNETAFEAGTKVLSSIIPDFNTVMDKGIKSNEEVLSTLANTLNSSLTNLRDIVDKLAASISKDLKAALPEGLNNSVSGPAKTAMDFFMSQGWTKNQSAGIVGNLQAESNLRTNAVGDNGKALGIAQWHKDRQDKFKEIMNKELKDSSLLDQLKFVQWELTHTESKAGNLLKSVTSAAKAADVVRQEYERPSKDPVVGAHQTRRNNAEQLSNSSVAISAANLTISNPTISNVETNSSKVSAGVPLNLTNSPELAVQGNNTLIPMETPKAFSDAAMGALKLKEDTIAFWEEADAAAKPYLAQLSKLGPEGEVVIALYSGMKTMSTTLTEFHNKLSAGTAGFKDYANVAMSALNTVQSILSAASAAKIANIEKEISAEQKRDGKSAQSVAKIEAMEKKKDAIAKKQFNTNKKLMMAQAVISTAAGVAGALSLAPNPMAIPLAMMIGALGAAQLAIIAGTSYESANTAQTVSTPSSLSIGKRGDSVNLAAGANANAGGEVGYLRGANGTGTNANNYNTIGSAYGGELMRGYGNAGFIVGEKGPEKLTPETPIHVTPANKLDNPNVNATINIQALDASGVEEILVGQKGNIIKMLRDAANASGQGFLEDVNVNVFTRPNVNKL